MFGKWSHIVLYSLSLPNIALYKSSCRLLPFSCEMLTKISYDLIWFAVASPLISSFSSCFILKVLRLSMYSQINRHCSGLLFSNSDAVTLPCKNKNSSIEQISFWSIPRLYASANVCAFVAGMFFFRGIGAKVIIILLLPINQRVKNSFWFKRLQKGYKKVTYKFLIINIIYNIFFFVTFVT